MKYAAIIVATIMWPATANADVANHVADVTARWAIRAVPQEVVNAQCDHSADASKKAEQSVVRPQESLTQPTQRAKIKWRPLRPVRVIVARTLKRVARFVGRRKKQ
ncbi:hypothetical protein LCGC14_1028300 [marine sediment metagenome]|uniref:Uncharacterized protein n=1 Tax=marine sediment metagenome TaxID=412755 RepID=A0A0F9R1E2_9ZZZZ